MKRLEGKVAIVTGASAGIGEATARLFAQEGASVVVVARRAEMLDALVHAITEAGGEALAVAGDVGEEAFARVMVERTLARFGRLDVVINNAGILGAMGPVPGMAAYAASKAGLVGLTQVLAAEYGAQRIRVNALLPGGTDTEAAREFADTPEAQEFVAGLHALKRIAAPEEIAHAALYLASDDASFTTGSAMLVDGGVSINRV